MKHYECQECDAPLKAPGLCVKCRDEYEKEYARLFVAARVRIEAGMVRYEPKGSMRKGQQ